MNSDRVTLKLHKDMSVTSFGRATLNLGSALEEISKELTYFELRWKIDNDVPAPGTISAVGVGSLERVSEVVRKYGKILTAESENQPYTAGRKVQLAIDRLLSIRDPEVKTIGSETCDGEWSIAPRYRGTLATVIPDGAEADGTPDAKASVIDAIRGRVVCHVFIEDEISNHWVRYPGPVRDRWVFDHLGKEVLAVGAVYRSQAKELPSKLMNIFEFTIVPER